MSTPILAEPDTTGWLLEMTGNGDNMVYQAVRPGGDIIVIALKAVDRWYVSICDGTPLVPATFSDETDAVAWLTYLANLNTQPVTA